MADIVNIFTNELGNNRGIAERVLRLFSEYGVDKFIERNREDIEDCADGEEVKDYFWDAIYQWQNKPNCDNLLFMIDLLTALNCDYDKQSGIGYLANLMKIYYDNK